MQMQCCTLICIGRFAANVAVPGQALGAGRWAPDQKFLRIPIVIAVDGISHVPYPLPCVSAIARICLQHYLHLPPTLLHLTPTLPVFTSRITYFCLHSYPILQHRRCTPIRRSLFPMSPPSVLPLN